MEYTVRLKLTKIEPFDDLVYGNVDIDLTDHEGDPVLMKTDGYPTYHFANVVDDHLMKITHVLRGMEWQTSTPKHIMLYKAFGWKPPQFAHLPLILNKDGTKLSKRQGDIHVDYFIKLGYYPETLLNYITVPGGGFSRADGEILSLPELIKDFDINLMRKNSGRLEPDHLARINQTFLKRRIADGRINEIVNEVRCAVLKKYSETQSPKIKEDLTTEYLEQIIQWSQDRIHKIEDLINSDFEFLWFLPQHIDLGDVKISDILNILQSCKNCVQNMEQFEQSNISTEMKTLSKEHKIKFSEFMKFLRICFTGFKEGPSIGEIMTVLGKSKTIERLEHTIQLCKENKLSISAT